MPVRYRIVNVFTVGGERFSGNPLCVFEDARGLDDRTMQALARQFNFPEVTFILPSTTNGVAARVRIFNPTFEVPFAGHPTLGTAHVVREVIGAGDRFVLEMGAGLVEVVARRDHWTLRTPQRPTTRPLTVPSAELAEILGLDEEAISGTPLWVDTGLDQLIVPLRTEADVRHARPDSAAALTRFGLSTRASVTMIYVWARSGDEVFARFFDLLHGAVVEDAATGSACANLGGWLVATAHPLPVRLLVHQGQEIDRPSLLSLYVDESRSIFVGGGVIDLGCGTLTLDDD